MQPADLHAAAWKELFDADLAERDACGLSGFRPFDGEVERVRVETARLASLSSPHLLLPEIRITCERHDAMVEIETGFDDAELALEHPHLCPGRWTRPRGSMRASTPRAHRA